ncbi:hypothetical protein HBI25_084720 [Parastagonospora nodorum]|nr:hypothetical protein HBH74_160500 [Parastagonospora nodorum]KAH4918833.1 hypothetical protein HBH73_229720 [Parastagonospora nodorum]KAH5080209.1 hypothetical protein HBH95_080870 [Parastagonospora nodorum]KAH5429710.1 hypothetical protein HBI32_074510 [Parastagonospora nodorum]KAH5527019.1 hypothetical protein HBI27_239430 [Parastagonospora nodorum]
MSFFHFDRLSLEDNDSESGKQAYDECGYVSVDLGRALSATDEESASGDDNGGYESEAEDDEKVPDINMAIQGLKETGGMVHIWKGPVIVYGIKEFIGHSIPKGLVNISGEKSGEYLLHLMNFFNAIQDPVKMICCVRINPDKDVDKHGRPK